LRDKAAHATICAALSIPDAKAKRLKTGNCHINYVGIGPAPIQGEPDASN
jgi:hypothetical protein